MNLQNYTSNLFYSMQFSFLYEGMTVEDMEEEDPIPDWFIDWWKIYGLSALFINSYSLHMLKIPGFSEPTAHMTGILYKSIRSILDIKYLSFLHGTRRCGHV